MCLKGTLAEAGCCFATSLHLLLGLLSGLWLLIFPLIIVTDRQLSEPGVEYLTSSPRGLPACFALQKLQEEEEEEEESNTSKAPTTVSENL